MLRFLTGIAVGWVATWWFLTGEAPVIDRVSAWLGAGAAPTAPLPPPAPRPARPR